MSEDDDRDPETGRFLPGNSGNGGRKRGARNKLTTAFLEDLYDAWQQRGREIIDAAIEQNPAAVLRVIGSILPKDINLKRRDPLADATDEELRERIRELNRITGHLISPGRAGHADGSNGSSGGPETPSGVH